MLIAEKLQKLRANSGGAHEPPAAQSQEAVARKLANLMVPRVMTLCEAAARRGGSCVVAKYRDVLPERTQHSINACSLAWAMTDELLRAEGLAVDRWRQGEMDVQW